MRTTKYNKSNLTPQTRLMDLVNKKYHRYLKEMIIELRRAKVVDDGTPWWQVRQLTFIRPQSMNNYEPIAKFIMQTSQDGRKGLKCSITTFLRYLTAKEHSNLNVKYESVKSLIFSMVRYLRENKNGII